MNCFNCEFDKGYDCIIKMTEHIQNLMTDDSTEDLLSVVNDNKDKKIFQVVGIIMTKLGPYMIKHKADVIGLISNFFVRSEEETKKKSVIEIYKEFGEVLSNEEVRELFSFAQTKTPVNMFGSAQESTEETANEDSSDT